MPWIRKNKPPKRYRNCKLPGFFSQLGAAPGSQWECPRCGKRWTLYRDDFSDEAYYEENSKAKAGCDGRG